MGRKGNNTKQILVTTALDLIWQNSYGSVSVDDICNTANIKKGSFYYYFASKTALAIAAMEEARQNMQVEYDRVFSVANPPLLRLEKFADSAYQSQTEIASKYGHVCGCPCASLASEIGASEEGIRHKFDEISLWQERYFASIIRDMIHSKILPDNTNIDIKAHEIHIFIVGQMTMARIQNDLKMLKLTLKPGLMQLLGLPA